MARLQATQLAMIYAGAMVNAIAVAVMLHFISSVIQPTVFTSLIEDASIS
jgi:hypothetical protein